MLIQWQHSAATRFVRSCRQGAFISKLLVILFNRFFQLDRREFVEHRIRCCEARFKTKVRCFFFKQSKYLEQNQEKSFHYNHFVPLQSVKVTLSEKFPDKHRARGWDRAKKSFFIVNSRFLNLPCDATEIRTQPTSFCDERFISWGRIAGGNWENWKLISKETFLSIYSILRSSKQQHWI